MLIKQILHLIVFDKKEVVLDEIIITYI